MLKRLLKPLLAAILVFAVLAGIPAFGVALRHKTDGFFTLKAEDGSARNVDAFSYIVGVLAAEMPLSYEPEALKAGAVAAFTLAYRRQSQAGYITADSASFQAYKPLKKSSKHYKKLAPLVREVFGQVITYENTPILAAYHAMSAGKTESCKDIWGEDLPYLQAVESPWDKASADFSQWTELVFSDFAEKLGAPEAQTAEVVARTSSGAVTELRLGEKSLSGADVRAQFLLPSASFTLERDGDMLKIVTLGFGHGVGMSQNGANAMAKEGKGWREILAWYYVGTSVTKVNAD